MHFKKIKNKFFKSENKEKKADKSFPLITNFIYQLFGKLSIKPILAITQFSDFYQRSKQ